MMCPFGLTVVVFKMFTNSDTPLKRRGLIPPTLECRLNVVTYFYEQV
jgi:hypothetical protein